MQLPYWGGCWYTQTVITWSIAVRAAKPAMPRIQELFYCPNGRKDERMKMMHYRERTLVADAVQANKYFKKYSSWRKGRKKKKHRRKLVRTETERRGE